MANERREVDQRFHTLISPLRLFWTDLYERIFDPDYVPEAVGEEGLEGVTFPASDDEFDVLMEELDAEEAAQRRTKLLEEIGQRPAWSADHR